MPCRIFQVDFKECFHVCPRWRMDLAGSAGFVCCWYIKLPESGRVISVPIRVYNTRECSRMSHSLAPNKNSPVPNMTESLQQSVSPGRHLESHVHFCCWPPNNSMSLKAPNIWWPQPPAPSKLCAPVACVKLICSDYESSWFPNSTFTKSRFLVFLLYAHVNMCTCVCIHVETKGLP